MYKTLVFYQMNSQHDFLREMTKSVESGKLGSSPHNCLSKLSIPTHYKFHPDLTFENVTTCAVCCCNVRDNNSTPWQDNTKQTNGLDDTGEGVRWCPFKLHSKDNTILQRKTQMKDLIAQNIMETMQVTDQA